MTKRPVDERGMSESLQWSVLLPLVMLMILGLIQAGVVLHGRNVVASAALAAAEAQAVAGDGEQAALRVAHAMVDPDGVTLERVEVGGDADTVNVRVVARIPVWFDLGLSRVESTASQPRER